MRATLLIVALAAGHMTAFAQGKVRIGNDANHLIVVDEHAARYKLGIPAFGGLPAPQVGTTYDVMSSLTAQLWGGTSPSALTLQAQFSPAGGIGLSDGLLTNAAVTLNGIPAGINNAYFQILVFETSAGSYWVAASGIGLWHAATPVFQASVGGFAPTPLVNSPNWPQGLIILSISGFEPPFGVSPVLHSLGRTGNQFRFYFVARAYRTYTVEYCDSVATANWTTLTNIPVQTNNVYMQVSDAITVEERHFRVRSP